jgi:hypothetical protein
MKLNLYFGLTGNCLPSVIGIAILILLHTCHISCSTLAMYKISQLVWTVFTFSSSVIYLFKDCCFSIMDEVMYRFKYG